MGVLGEAKVAKVGLDLLRYQVDALICGRDAAGFSAGQDYHSETSDSCESDVFRSGLERCRIGEAVWR